MPLFAKHNGVFVIMFGYNGSRNSGGQKSQAKEPQITTPQNTEKDSPLKKTLVLFIKIAVAAVIVALLIKYNYQDFRNGIREFNYYWFIPAFIAYVTHMFFCSWRWYRLAQMIGVKLSVNEAFVVTMQSYFWSLVIPGGAIGGDVARLAITAKRQPPGAKAEGILTILMDRAIGMVALFGMTIVLVLLSIPQLMNIEIAGTELSNTVKISGIIAILLLCIAGNAAMMALFFHRQLTKLAIVRRLFAWGDSQSHGMVQRLTDAIDLYAKNWRQLSYLTIVSVFMVHGMTVLAVLFLIYGLNISQISLIGIFTAVSIGNIAGLIPLSLSGIGLRDAVLLGLLRADNLPDNIAVIPILYSALIIGVNILCAVFFIADSGSKTSGKENS